MRSLTYSRKILKITGYIIVLLLCLCLAGYVVLLQPRVQTKVVQIVAGRLTEKLGTKVGLTGVKIDFVKTIALENIYFEDKKGDTLLFANKLKVDIGIFSLRKKQLQLNSIHLEKAFINLKKDPGATYFNIKFLTERFSQGKHPIDLDVKKVGLESTRFFLKDDTKFLTLKIDVGSIQISLDQFDLKEHLITADGIQISKTHVSINKSASYISSANSMKKKLGPFLNKEWQFGAKQIMVAESSFLFDNYKKPKKAPLIDFNHLFVDNIHFNIEQAYMNKDTISAEFTRSSFSEKSGLQIIDFSAAAMVSGKNLQTSNMLLKTPKSLIKESFAMEYASFKDFKNFVKKVALNAQLNQSKIAVSDIGYFVPSLYEIEDTLSVTGRIYGTISNLKGKKLIINSDYCSYNGKIALRGLPYIPETYIDLKAAQFYINPLKLAEAFPHLKVDQKLFKMGDLSFSGRFTGFIKDFVANGTVVTTLGEFSSDINLKLADDPKKNFFSGRLSARNFDFGKLLDADNLLGNVTFDAKVYGNGTNIHNITAKLNANIQEINFKDYAYTEIVINGQLQQKLFEGMLFVNDENLFLDFHGTADFSKKTPFFDFNAQIRNAKLDKLNLSDKPYSVNTNLEINFQGDQIDSIDGRLGIYDTKIQCNEKLYPLDSFIITSAINDIEKELIIKSEVLEGTIKGHFLLNKLPATIGSYLSVYFPYFTSKNTGYIPDESINLNLQVHDTKNLMGFFIPELNEFNNAVVTGNFNNKDQHLDLVFQVPEVKYKKTIFKDIDISIGSNTNALHVSTTIKNIAISDSMHVIGTELFTSINKDTISLHLLAGHDSSKNKIDISSIILNKPELLNISIDANEITINNKRWKLHANNNISITDKHIYCNNVELSSNRQSVKVESEMINDSITALLCQLNNINLFDFSKLLGLKKRIIKGTLNGKFYIKNPVHKPVYRCHVKVLDLSINEDTLGNLFFEAVTNQSQNSIDLSANLGDISKSLYISGSYFIEREDHNLSFQVRVKKLNLNIFQVFLKPVFSDIHGTVSSNLKLSGGLSTPILSGKANIMDAGVTVDYLQTHYTIPEAEVVFKENEILLNKVSLYDSLDNLAVANGRFYHDYFKKVSIDATINTDNLLLLNTKKEDNSIYYGTGFGEGQISFSGLLKNLEINIALITTGNTKITTLMNDETETGKQSFVSFIDKSNTKKTITRRGYVNLKGLKVGIDLEITPEAYGQIIIDPEAGDLIRVNGYGNIKMEINTHGNFRMYGSFEIDKGDYLFTFYNKLINKKFDIENGGTISWTGDPYEAIINVSAVYNVRASSYDLIQGVQDLSEEEMQNYKKRTPFQVKLILINSLFSPDIDFEIIDKASLSDYISRKLLEIKQDKNELNKQVFGLLVLNRFIPTEIPGNEVWRSGVNTSVSEFISAQLSYWASQLSEDVELNVAYYGNEANGQVKENPELLKRRELQLALTKRFFDDRVSVDIGGNIDIDGEEYKGQEKDASNIVGDFNIEYKITRTGNLRVRVFRKSDFDILSEENKSKTGIGIFYRREFNKLSELWSKKRTRKKV